jgi:cytidylate kinase
LINQFIKEKRNIQDVPDSGFPFVTISRQPGAGGHLLSYVLITDFLKEHGDLFKGWHVFDKQLCEVVAQDPELNHAMESLAQERYRSEFEEFMETLFTGRSSHYLLYRRTFNVVHMLASIGKVIIVGRAAACVTRHLKAGIHVRLVAPESNRIVWMMKRFKLSREEATRDIHRQESDRRKLLKKFFSRDIDDPLLYDTVWNSGTVDLPEISSSIIQLIKKRAPADRS